jgi:hypothetical protein
MTAMKKLVADGEKYFGNENKVKKYAVDPKLFGKAALDAAERSANIIAIQEGVEKTKVSEDPPSRRRKAENEKQEASPSPYVNPNAPVWIKVHQDHVAVETLKYFGLPWEYDKVSLFVFLPGLFNVRWLTHKQHNHDYIIISQEMNTDETQVLFDHTRRLRRQQGTAAVYALKDREHDLPEHLTFVRRKSSLSPGRSSTRRRRKSKVRTNVELGHLF